MASKMRPAKRQEGPGDTEFGRKQKKQRLLASGQASRINVGDGHRKDLRKPPALSLSSFESPPSIEDNPTVDYSDASSSSTPRPMQLRRVSLVPATCDIPELYSLPTDERTVTKVGRERAKCGLWLASTRHNGLISRTHARLTPLGNELFMLTDESKNGCYVNGRKIKQAVLKSGDIIVFGGFSRVKYGEFKKNVDAEFAYMYEPVGAVPEKHELLNMYEKYGKGVVASGPMQAVASSQSSTQNAVAHPSTHNLLHHHQHQQLSSSSSPMMLPSIYPSSSDGSNNSSSMFFLQSTSRGGAAAAAAAPSFSVSPHQLDDDGDGDEDEHVSWISWIFSRIYKGVVVNISTVGEFFNNLSNVGDIFRLAGGGGLITLCWSYFQLAYHVLTSPRWFEMTLAMLLFLCLYVTYVIMRNILDATDLNLEHLDCYYQLLTRQHAETMLKEHGERGVYLLRPGEMRAAGDPGDAAKLFIVSYVNEGGDVLHHKMWRLKKPCRSRSGKMARAGLYPNSGNSISIPDMDRKGLHNVPAFISWYIGGQGKAMRPYKAPHN